MLQDKESMKLLYQAISELAEQMGQNQMDTKSVSLIFLDMDLEHEVFERVFINFLKYIAHKKAEDIEYNDLIRLIDDALPEDRELNPLIKNQIIIGFANNYLPELKPIASDIQNEMGTSINPELDI
ncbi:hypothetical protein RM578_09200 [Staphylococcus haemolyticus]|uniref:hypothetical protein n=1 Tax=Staphylococcus haemolyticus TaxID=1283 RepID=UPI002887BDAC|nr:hypothetical protein [Staphylococcus haemolyticus]MDT0738624.1 hypothetical protein [Staphylococcus haemolyticus]